MNDAFTIQTRYRGFWLFKEKIVELRAKVPSLKLSKVTVDTSVSSGDSAMLRALAERLCGVLSEQLPFLREPVSELNRIFLKNLRALDGMDRADTQLMFELSGEVLELDKASFRDSDAQGSDMDDGSLINTSQSIPVSFKVNTKFHSYESREVVHSVVPLLSPSLKLHLPNVFPVMILRNPGFKFGSLYLGFERYQYKSKISRWCHLPTVDYRLELKLTPSRLDPVSSIAYDSVLLRGTFSKDADPKFFREMEMLMVTIGDFFNLGPQINVRIREVLS